MEPHDGFVTDGLGVIRRWPRAATALLGYPAAQMVGRPVTERLLSGPDGQLLRAAVRELLAAADGAPAADGPVVLAVQAVTAGGVAVALELSLTAVRGAAGGQVRVAVRDVTEDLGAVRELASQTPLLLALLDGLGEGVAVCDADGRLLLVNDFLRRLGLSGERAAAWGWHEGVAVLEADGVRPLSLDQSPLFRALMGEAVPGQELLLGPTVTAARRLVARSRPLHRPDGSLAGALALYRDATGERDAPRDQGRAGRDRTTGLLSAAALRQQLPDVAEVGRGAQLLLLAVDDYRSVCALAGQAAGDALLAEVADRLQALQRPGCVLARAEIDIFAVLIDGDVPEPGVTAETDLSSRVHALFERPWAAPQQWTGTGMAQVISVSTGLACTLDRSIELWHSAAMALYEGRVPGGDGRGVFRPELKQALRERLVLREDLATALEQGQLTLRYQPQVDLRTGTVRGVEALVRWQHPTRGFLRPDEFIPLAEQTGLIAPLGRWVLRQACQQLQGWREAGLPPLRMAVNVSAGQLEPTLVADVRTILDSTGTAPDLLDLEITESVAVRQDAVSHEVLQRLHELGVRLSVDDFGTGYSMLGQLRTFPFSQLKIDKSFVQDLDQDSQAPLIIAILSMARALGLEVVAEGVENEQQLAFLHAEDCPFAQGYLFARPLAPTEVVELLRSGQPLPGFATRVPHRTAPHRTNRPGLSEMERLARPLLEQVERLTGLESSYLTQVTGGVQQVLLARNSGDLIISEGLSVPWADTLCSRALTDGPAIITDAGLAYPDCTAAGELGIHTYVGAPIRNTDGELFGTLCAASTGGRTPDPEILAMLDLYAQLLGERISHQALRVSHQQQRAEQHQRSRFLAQAEHQIRQPMMVMHGWAQLLVRHPDQPEGDRQRALQKLLSSSQQVTQHLDRLLDDARTEIVRHTLDPHRLTLTALIGATLASAPEQHTHTIVCAIDPDTHIHADPVALERTLADALTLVTSNSPPGSPIVISSQLLGTGVEITIRARHGQLPAGLDPFAAFPHADTPHGSLYSARVLTEAMGGTILTHNHPGHGTSISLWLRAA